MGCDIPPSQHYVHSHGRDIKCAVLSDFSWVAFCFTILPASFCSRWSFLVNLCLCIFPGVTPICSRPSGYGVSASALQGKVWALSFHQARFLHSLVSQRPAPSLGFIFGAVTFMRSIWAMFPCLLWVPQWLWPMDILRKHFLNFNSENSVCVHVGRFTGLSLQYLSLCYLFLFPTCRASGSLPSQLWVRQMGAGLQFSWLESTYFYGPVELWDFGWSNWPLSGLWLATGSPSPGSDTYEFGEE